MRRFRDHATADLANGIDSKAARAACPIALWPIARRKLDHQKKLERLKSPTTTKVDLFIPSHRPPTRPGVMLREEFLKPLGLTQEKLARAMGMTRVRLNEILNGKRGITADSALRLAKALGTSADFWLRLQLACDLYDALRSPKAKSLARVRRVVPAA